MPNVNPHCGNCIFRHKGVQANYCKKWNNVPIRNPYWCKSWGPNIQPQDLAQFSIDSDSFKNYLNNMTLKDETSGPKDKDDIFGGDVSSTSNRPTGGGTSGGRGGGY